jgi:hypothetical protein
MRRVWTEGQPAEWGYSLDNGKTDACAPADAIRNSAYGVLDVLKQKKQMHRVYRAGFKTKAQIPQSGGFIFCMHDYRTDTGNVRCPQGTQKSIFEEG